MIHCIMHFSSSSCRCVQTFRRVVFDHLDKAFCILQLDVSELHHKGNGPHKGDEVGGMEGKEPHRDHCRDAEENREEVRESNVMDSNAIIRRVDLIVSPPSQYPFALLSWTGSKVS